MQIRHFIKSFFGAATAVLSLAPLYASADGNLCTDALIQDVGVLDMRDSQALALSQLYYQETGSDKKWSARIKVPILGVPIEGGAGAAESSRQKYFSQSQLDWTKERLVSVATQELSANSVSAYRACIDGLQKSGPRILIHNSTPTQVTATVTWYSAPGARTESQSNFSITGGSFETPFPFEWTTGMSHAVIINRHPDVDLRITASIGAESDAIFVSRVPPPPPPPPPLTGRDRVIKAFKDGETCTLTIKSQQRVCLGTIARNTAKPYSIVYIGDGSWSVSGHMCKEGHPWQSATYGGINPDSNRFSFWGATFIINKKGFARAEADGSFGGKIVCPG